MQGHYLFQKVSSVDSEGESSKFESDDELPVKFMIEREKAIETRPSIENDETSRDSPIPVPAPKVKKRYLRSSRDSFSDTSRDSLKKPKEPPRTSKRRRSAEKKVVKQRTEEDSSNDDDASSRSTLDYIIPPLKNFQGANNPFNTLFGKDEVGKEALLPDVKPKVTAKLVRNPMANGGVRIVRTVRRRLSAKDIIIGPNQEVKRKKTKRKVSNGDVEVSFMCLLN